MTDSASAHSALLAPDALRASALATLPGASVVAFDPSLRILLAQGEALRDQGSDAAELVGRRLDEVLAPDRYDRLAPYYLRALEGEPQAFENPAPAGDLWYWVTVAPLRDEGDLIYGGIAISQDITDRKRVERELAGQRQLVSDVLDSLGIPVSVKDGEGRFVLINRTYEEWLACRREDLVGKGMHDLHPEPYASAFAADDQRVLRDGSTTQAESVTPARDGTQRMLSITRSPLRSSDGRIYGLCAAGVDVTARRAMEEELREATTRFETAFSHAPIGMALVGLDGAFLRANRALCVYLGYDETELGGMTFADVTHPDHVEADLALIGRLLAGEITNHTMEKRYITKAGAETWAALAISLVFDAAGNPLHFISQIQNIDAQKRLQARLQQMADEDPLTGALNRRRFDEELTRQLARCRRHGERAALLILDLDGFKAVNDRHGHRIGDQLIAHVARTLRSRVRDTDVLARIGGDEFAIILPHATAARAAQTADALLAHLRGTPLIVDGRALTISASAGFAVLDADTAEDEAFVAADRAMYASKDRNWLPARAAAAS